jgi:hypothetical protein
MFHSITIAPGAGPRVPNLEKKSDFGYRREGLRHIHDIGDLDSTRLASCADLEDDLRAALALEVGTATHEDRPSLADETRAGRDGDRLRDVVDTVVEEDDLATVGVGVERVLDDRGVVLFSSSAYNLKERVKTGVDSRWYRRP